MVDECDWSILNRHNNTSGACQENECANGGTSKGITYDPFLTPPEAFAKD